MAEKRRVAAISIAIPCKDRVAELKETINSILGQTVLPDEVIIVDDGSIVPLTSAALALGSHELTIRIMRNDPNIGAAISLNRAVDEAKNSVVAFLDSDDCLLPTYVERIAERWFGPNRPKSVLAVGFYWCNQELKPYRVQIAAPIVSHEELQLAGNVIGGSSILSVDRDAYMACGGHPLIRASYDWGLMLRMSSIAPIQTLQEPLLLYRSPTTSALDNLTRAYRKQVIALMKLLRSMPIEERHSVRPRVRKLVARHLALAGKSRISWRMLVAVYKAEKRVDLDLMKTGVINLLGPMRYHEILKLAARVRTQRAALK